MAKRKNSNSNRKGATNPSIDLLKSVSQGSSSRSLEGGGSTGLTRLTVGSQVSAKSIQFGSPSDKGPKTASRNTTGSTWTGLLESVSTGGISDLVGGGGVLSAGLDYLSSGLKSLFGGNAGSATEPLTRFALADTQDQTINVGGAQTANQVGTSADAFSGIYDNSQSSRLSQASRADIVQTIKHALLTSSSLNDVIGEL